MNFRIKYDFTTVMWQYSGQGGWYFIDLPVEMAKEIRENLKWQEEGWGRMKASAKIRNSEWNTSIWYSTKRKTYILPINAEIRKNEKLEVNVDIPVVIWV